MVGYYLGSLGEMQISTNLGFQIVDAATGSQYASGTLAARGDDTNTWPANSIGRQSKWHLLALLAVGLTISASAVFGQVFQELHSFTGGADGTNPEGALIQARDGSFYGTTTYGPGLLGYGTVFKITPEGVLTTLAAFNGTNGAFPCGALLEASDGNFYGTTLSGWRGAATVIGMTPEGQITTLARFIGGTDHLAGNSPVGDLAQGPDGKLYGVATHGGDYNSEGTIFRVSTNGNPEMLHFFYGSDGLYPSGGLLLASDSNFYGVTAGGGLCNGNGSIYRLTTNGQFTTIASFCQGVGNAVWPRGKLLQADDGNFYGAAGGGWVRFSSALRLAYLPRSIVSWATMARTPLAA